jgi:hypothetical protein
MNCEVCFFVRIWAYAKDAKINFTGIRGSGFVISQ